MTVFSSGECAPVGHRLSFHAQLGSTDPLLGGTPGSAAACLCLAFVAAAFSRTRRTTLS